MSEPCPKCGGPRETTLKIDTPPRGAALAPVRRLVSRCRNCGHTVDHVLPYQEIMRMKDDYRVLVDMPWDPNVEEYYQGRDVERHEEGTFESCEEALAACRRVVDEWLRWRSKPGRDAEFLLTQYGLYGPRPLVVSRVAPCEFSAEEHARGRCASIVADAERAAEVDVAASVAMLIGDMNRTAAERLKDRRRTVTCVASMRYPFGDDAEQEVLHVRIELSRNLGISPESDRWFTDTVSFVVRHGRAARIAFERDRRREELPDADAGGAALKELLGQIREFCARVM